MIIAAELLATRDAARAKTAKRMAEESTHGRRGRQRQKTGRTSERSSRRRLRMGLDAAEATAFLYQREAPRPYPHL